MMKYRARMGSPQDSNNVCSATSVTVAIASEYAFPEASFITCHGSCTEPSNTRKVETSTPLLSTISMIQPLVNWNCHSSPSLTGFKELTLSLTGSPQDTIMIFCHSLVNSSEVSSYTFIPDFLTGSHLRSSSLLELDEPTIVSADSDEELSCSGLGSSATLSVCMLMTPSALWVTSIIHSHSNLNCHREPSLAGDRLISRA